MQFTFNFWVPKGQINNQQLAISYACKGMRQIQTKLGI